ncbi:MAG: phenylalanine--tRNA ligase subunit beta [Crocinitomicaceae bacterium]|nr:phenylalanine--tRNA ligase subunit beta [Crocinitomicaceae bacterium]
MKVSYRKIKEFLPTTVSATEAAAVLTATGLEIEGVETVEDITGGLRGLVVGEITACSQHPNADRLRCCKVNIGKEELDIVCGAPNAKAGLHVLVATVGTTLYPVSGEPFKIKKSKIRGEVSMGMLCGQDEVGLGEDTGGIMELDSALKPGTLASEAFNIGTDEVLEIGLTPNRNDAMGHMGVARDLRAGLEHGTVCEITETGLAPVKTPGSLSLDFKMGLKGLNATVEASDLASKYALVEIDNVKVGPSPDKIQSFLKAIGVGPINNIVDATNYVLHELGTPLHAFDYDTIGGEVLNVRLAREGEKIVTLDDVERKLSSVDLVIADAEEAMCIAGVFGGSKHGVTDKTTRVVIEAAYFNPVSVRKTAKKHGLSTDASFRFERQIDPNMVKHAASRVAELVMEWAGGEVTGAEFIGSTEDVKGATVEIEWAMLNRVIGAVLDRDRVGSILESLDIEVSSKNDERMVLEVPAYRSDVTRPADIVEEILRIHGFDQIAIPTTISSTVEIPDRPDREDVLFGLASTLVAKGYNEIMSNSLTKASYVESVSDKSLNPKTAVEILNPLSNDLGAMRQSLVFQGLEAIARNKNHKVSNLRLFEFGRTYAKKAKGYSETEHLSLFVCGNKGMESWYRGSAESDIFTIKEAVVSLLTQVGIAHKVCERPDDGGLLLEGNEILIGEKVIGRFGMVHPDVASMCGVEDKVFWADLLVKPLLEARKKRKITAQDLPKFPSVRRDLSLIIDKGVSFESIKSAAERAEKQLLKAVNLFDVYEGDKLEPGKVSYAISLTIQDQTATLTDKKIDKCVARILDAITEKTGATLR